MPVDSNHASFPLGSDIAFNVAYRDILKDYGTGGGKLLFYPGADVTEAQNMAAKDLIHYGQVATQIRRFIEWKLGLLRHEKAQDNEEEKDELKKEIPPYKRGHAPKR